MNTSTRKADHGDLGIMAQLACPTLVSKPWVLGTVLHEQVILRSVWPPGTHAQPCIHTYPPDLPNHEDWSNVLLKCKLSLLRSLQVSVPRWWLIELIHSLLG